MHSIRRRSAVIAGATAAIALTLSACGANNAAEAPTVVETETDVVTEREVTEEAVETEHIEAAPAATGEAVMSDRCQAVLDEGGDILVWSWEPTLPAAVDAFNAAYPNTHVTLNNIGMTEDQYTAIQNAITAGSGGPDLAHVEYQVIPQFTITGALADLSQFGANEDLQGVFTPGTWSAVTEGDHVYGLPMDSGPMALFYNADVFEQYGIEVPTTWDEFIEAARQLKAANPDIIFTNDGNDSGMATSIMWQAQGTPFTVDGTTVGIDLANDPGAAKYAQVWQTLIDEHLVGDMPGWSDEWFTALGNGSLATLISAGWMPGNFQSGAPAGAGSWRVAPLPQFEAGQNNSAELGGSALAVLEGSQHQELAYCVGKWLNAGPGVPIKVDAGLFPATNAELADEEFLARPSEYFGGQEINRVLADSAAHVVQGWHYLPFSAYANSIFPETAGQAFLGHGTLAEGLQSWQDRLHQFAETQGFTLTN